MWLCSIGLLLLCLLQFSACAEDYYKLLGIDRAAPERDIKRAYRTLSKRFHPDKNPGDESAKQKFVEVAEAYEALIDPNLRKIYDQYGHEGLAQHKGNNGRQHHDPFDIFSRFFGGGGHFGHQPGQRRGHDMEVRISIPLGSFYNGQRTEFEIEKQQVCEECEGTGSADGQVDTCPVCNGHGITIQKHMLAPGCSSRYKQLAMHAEDRGRSLNTNVPSVKALVLCGNPILSH